jgi:quercetin dioxygenase-like cupin family protein
MYEEIQKQLIITGPQDGETLAVAGSNYRIVLTGEQTAGKLAIIEMNVPPNSGPIPHEHPGIQESFYVLEGQVELKSETQTYVAKKGAIVTIPFDGPVHCFKNTGNTEAKLLCIVTPAGLDDFFREIGTPLAFGEQPKQVAVSEEQKQKMNEIAVRYGQKLYPPDYLE